MTAFSRRDIYASAAVALAASLWLLALAPTYQIEHFYVAGQSLMSNDQVGYLTSARWLVDTGEIRSHLIFPSHVREPMWRLYMPGHYFVLAGGHLLFGDGPVAWRMPAMLCFVLSAVGVFLIGRRFYGRACGYVAALLFITFPPMTAFAFTAMPQLPFTAASVAAFCVIAYLPERWRFFCIPIVLTVPFLFRETGALLIIPMILISLEGRRAWLKALASTACSVLWLYAVLSWQISSGKGALPMDGSRFNYANAFRPPAPELTLTTRLHSLQKNLSRNIEALQRHAERNDHVFVPLMILCALSLLAIIRGMGWSPPGGLDRLALGSALLFAAIATVITLFYTWALYRGLRSVLFTFPFLAISTASAILPLLERVTRFATRLRWPATLVPALLGVGIALTVSVRGNQELARQIDPEPGARAVERMESLELDERGTLIAPLGLSLDYVLRHYPLRWSFIPSNDRTLKLLAATYPVQTIILREAELEATPRISEQAIHEIGLVRTRTFEHRLLRSQQEYVLFERPR